MRERDCSRGGTGTRRDDTQSKMESSVSTSSLRDTESAPQTASNHSVPPSLSSASGRPLRPPTDAPRPPFNAPTPRRAQPQTKTLHSTHSCSGQPHRVLCRHRRQSTQRRRRTPRGTARRRRGETGRHGATGDCASEARLAGYPQLCTACAAEAQHQQGRETIDGGKGPLFGLRGETAGQTRGIEGRQGVFEKLCEGSAALHGAVCRRRALETAIDPSRDVAWDGVQAVVLGCWG